MARVTGASSQGSGKPRYVFTYPGVLSTSSGNIPWLPGQGTSVSSARAVVKGAPTGSSLLILIELINPSNPTAEVTLATLTVSATAFEGTVSFTSTNIPVDHVLSISISQVGNAYTGDNLTVVVQ